MPLLVAVLHDFSQCAKLLGKTIDSPQRRDAKAIHRRGRRENSKFKKIDWDVEVIHLILRT